MSRRPARFKLSDLNRAVRVADKLGKLVDVLPDGTFRLRRESVEMSGTEQLGDVPEREPRVF